MSGMLFGKSDVSSIQNPSEINFVRVCADIFGIKILPCLILEDNDTNWHITKDGVEPFDPESSRSTVCVFIRNTKKYFKSVTVDRFRFSDGSELVMDEVLLNKEFFGFSFEEQMPVEIYLVADDIMIMLASSGYSWEVKKLSWITEKERGKIKKRHEAKKQSDKICVPAEFISDAQNTESEI